MLSEVVPAGFAGGLDMGRVGEAGRGGPRDFSLGCLRQLPFLGVQRAVERKSSLTSDASDFHLEAWRRRPVDDGCRPLLVGEKPMRGECKCPGASQRRCHGAGT